MHLSKSSGKLSTSDLNLTQKFPSCVSLPISGQMWARKSLWWNWLDARNLLKLLIAPPLCVILINGLSPVSSSPETLWWSCGSRWWRCPRIQSRWARPGTAWGGRSYPGPTSTRSEETREITFETAVQYELACTVVCMTQQCLMIGAYALVLSTYTTFLCRRNWVPVEE